MRYVLKIVISQKVYSIVFVLIDEDKKRKERGERALEIWLRGFYLGVDDDG